MERDWLNGQGLNENLWSRPGWPAGTVTHTRNPKHRRLIKDFEVESFKINDGSAWFELRTHLFVEGACSLLSQRTLWSISKWYNTTSGPVLFQSLVPPPSFFPLTLQYSQIWKDWIGESNLLYAPLHLRKGYAKAITVLITPFPFFQISQHIWSCV
jgi:hypothetical protein